ncbi:MAG TPA: bacterio-opsin activator domain-containing protein [Halococcus sp.]|nr:bacterio-opsin activator domain-containing protein [Halococcus sp.]
MATVAELELDAKDFALQETLIALDTVEFEVERVVAHDPEHIMPYVWVSGTDRDAIENALQNDPSVEDVELISEQEHRWLYQMSWVSQIRSLIQMLVEEDSTVLTAFGKADRWDLRILFPDREAVSRTYDYCEEIGLEINLRRIYDHDDSRAGQYNLTDDQQKALVTAFEQGFYEIPRDVTLDDLADELDISHQALSERLRRGYENMIKEGLIIGERLGGETDSSNSTREGIDDESENGL